MNAIAVVDKNWGLGIDGKLLIHLPEELKYFREKTLGKTIIIGRKTFESMNKTLLPGRETVILSRDIGFKADCQVFHSLDGTLEYLKGKPGQDLFVAGGETVYEQFFPYCDSFFITKLYAEFEADRYFPNIDKSPEKFGLKELSGVIKENGVEYQFFEYKRLK